LWMDKNEAASPTVLLESVVLTRTIEAMECREVAVSKPKWKETKY